MTAGCVAFCLPVQRRNLRIQEVSSVFSGSFVKPAQRAATRRSGFKPERRPVPFLFRGRPPGGDAAYIRTSKGPVYDLSARFGAAPGLQHQREGGLCRQRVPDGPTLDAPDCVADQNQRKTRADAERKLRTSRGLAGGVFGRAPRVAFRPSPHPRIRWTVASPGRAICAHGHMRPPPRRVRKCPTKC